MIKPSYERIKFLQNQLRTAIQNHHVLLLKSRLAPQDNEIKNQMNILQSLIISMGRTQNELLDQLERELENNVVARAEVGRHLSWSIPKNVPVFKSNCFKYDGTKVEENGPLNVPKCSVPSKPNPRVYSRMHSLLKPIKPKESSSPDVKSEEHTSVWKNPKKLQSVLKPKSSNEVKGFIRLQLQSETTKICGDSINEESVVIEESGISLKRRKTTDSEPNSRSSSVSPKPMSAPKPDHRRKVVETKLLTRSKRRLAVEAAAAAAKAASFSGNSEKDINDLEDSLKNEPLDSSVHIDDKILQNLGIYEGMGKVKFLETFGLISLSERDALRVKKGGRKRRTAAGQSNFYNDYFQHSALSMKNPKWRYEMQPVRRAPRDTSKKASLLEGTRRGSSPPEIITSGEVTPEEKASPPRDIPLKNVREASTETAGVDETLSFLSGEKAEEESDIVGGPASQNSIVVEAPALEEDEEKDKDKQCIVCRAPGDETTLEICTVCGEKYHTACTTAESEGRCTFCLAQISGFRSIVGGEAGIASSSSLDVIKRYLPKNYKGPPLELHQLAHRSTCFPPLQR